MCFKSSLGYNHQHHTQVNLIFNFHIKNKEFRDVEAEYPVTGSELHPLDSS